MATKWDVLTARLAEAEAKASQLRRELAGLDATDCGLRCSGCGEVLATEGDFARHFVVADVRFLNLGECPARA